MGPFAKGKRARAEPEQTEAVSSGRKRQKRDPPSFATPGTLVKFLIGDEDMSIVFQVHKEFACYYSPVLDAAFNSDFIEGRTQTYRLQDTTDIAFRFLVQWLYGQKIDISITGAELRLEEPEDPDPTEDEKAAAEKRRTPRSKAFQNLCELWVLADKLSIPRLQNLAIEAIAEAMDAWSFLPTNCFHYVWENTAEDSPLRNLMLDRCACNLSGHGYVEEKERFPFEMLIELCVTFTSGEMAFGGVADAEKEVGEFLVGVEDG